MSKKRNHYVPQFLLRRFASRGNRKRHWIWQFRSGADPVEIVTKDAAVSTYFYGQPATGVEDAFADLEGAQASLLREIDAGTDPNDKGRELCSLVWSLAFRTKALRSHFAATAQRGIEQMRQVDEQTVAEAFERNIDKNFDRLLEAELAKYPASHQALIRDAMSAPGTPEAMKEHVLKEVAKSVPQVDGILGKIGALVGKATDSGHVKALVELLAEGKGVPDSFQVPHWSIEQFKPNTVVLGDCAVFAVGPGGDSGALGKFTKNFESLYAPISHDRVLVGRRDTGGRVFCLDEINVASVQCSLQAFFASRSTRMEVELSSQIETGAPILSDDELAQIAKESWSNLGAARSKQDGAE